VNAATILRTVRQRSQLSLRGLAARAGTSHATLSAYESGRKSPSIDTLDRIVRAAGYAIDISFERRASTSIDDRGRELVDVLVLAEQFPARHSPILECPVFGRGA